MKKLSILVFVLLCLTILYISKVPSTPYKLVFENLDQENNQNKEVIFENTKIVKITKEQIYKGNLLLINDKNPVHNGGVRTDIVKLSNCNNLINGYELNDSNIYMSKEIAQKFSEMVIDAKKDGVRHFIINSGYRTIEEQSVLFQEMRDGYALPAGASEHNSGLALDVGSSLMKMESAPEGKWLEKNAWRYGFILRYPKDKTEVTGIQYEPWHFRYVGLPHSVIMEEKNFALEEYLDFLKEQKSFLVTINGEQFIISYYSVQEEITIEVPTDLHWEISGNNMDGVIITVFLN